ncbi:MAG: hypothetical protein ABJN73_10645 [Nonlabens ulvanivorans]|uniref:hypothetical protein n=2 Tax=Nonlabens ulvanivorans TaxID=906888 RepID=UPI0032632FA5
MKNLSYLGIILLILIGCKQTNTSDDVSFDSGNAVTSTDRYDGPLLKVSDIPYACDHLNAENIKKWYNLEKVVWLAKPSNQGLENSCSAAFYAGSTNTNVSIQVYDYRSLEDLNTDIQILNEMNFEKLSMFNYPAYWSGGEVYQKALTVFYKGLKIVVTQPARDFFDEATHRKRSIIIAKEYLETFQN